LFSGLDVSATSLGITDAEIRQCFFGQLIGVWEYCPYQNTSSDTTLVVGEIEADWEVDFFRFPIDTTTDDVARVPRVELYSRHLDVLLPRRGREAKLGPNGLSHTGPPDDEKFKDSPILVSVQEPELGKEQKAMACLSVSREQVRKVFLPSWPSRTLKELMSEPEASSKVSSKK
jgi:hypothetical protein